MFKWLKKRAETAKKREMSKKPIPPTFYYTVNGNEISFTTPCISAKRAREIRQSIDMFHAIDAPATATRKAYELSRELGTDRWHTAIISGYYVEK